MNNFPHFRTPYFEIGIKNYLYGDAVLQMAKAADAAAVQYDIDVMMITPYLEIRRVAENTQRLIVLAPYMDLLSPGRGIADILPEAVREAGAQGVVINHCERPMGFSAIAQTIERARALNMLSFVCADTIEEGRALAMLHPDIINTEPSALIGGTRTSDMNYVREAIRSIKAVDPSIIVEQAASINSPEQVYHLILAGAEAVGSSSGIMTAQNPCAMAQQMICAVRRAWDARKVCGKGGVGDDIYRHNPPAI